MRRRWGRALARFAHSSRRRGFARGVGRARGPSGRAASVAAPLAAPGLTGAASRLRRRSLLGCAHARPGAYLARRAPAGRRVPRAAPRPRGPATARRAGFRRVRVRVRRAWLGYRVLACDVGGIYPPVARAGGLGDGGTQARGVTRGPGAKPEEREGLNECRAQEVG